MGVSITEQEFLRWLRSFDRTAFRLETQREYALGYEQADYERFLAGNPTSPDELDWWRPWLERVARYTAEGKRVSRVRIVDTPPTGYQRWLLWSDSWHERAGENIRYMPRSDAERIGLPMRDWWLLDDAYLLDMEFTADGNMAGKSLIADPATVASYISWRELALRHAVSAQHVIVTA
jgi:hypothetical protein